MILRIRDNAQDHSYTHQETIVQVFCLCARQQDNSGTSEQIPAGLSGENSLGASNRWLDFGDELDLGLPQLVNYHF